MCAACWGVTRLATYTNWLPALVVMLPSRVAAMCFAELKSLPLCIQAKLVLLMSYNVTFDYGDGAWAVVWWLAAVKEAAPPEDGCELPCPLWSHEGISFDSQATHKGKTAPSLPETTPRVVV